MGQAIAAATYTQDEEPQELEDGDEANTQPIKFLENGPDEAPVDATVAISFAADVGTPSISKMKFIDLREAWVMELRDRGMCKIVKVDTKCNPADFGTKLLSVQEFRRQRQYFLETPKYVRKKAKEETGTTILMDKS